MIGKILFFEDKGISGEGKVLDETDSTFVMSLNGKIIDIPKSAVQQKKSNTPSNEITISMENPVKRPRDNDSPQDIHDQAKLPKLDNYTVVGLLNLPFNPHEDALSDAISSTFSSFGSIMRIYVQKHVNPEEDQLYATRKAWIEFTNSSAAKRAVESSGDIEISDRPIKIIPHNSTNIPLPPTFCHGQNGVWLSDEFRAEALKNWTEHGGSMRRSGPPIIEEPHAECWFCLANPAVEKHLLVSIGRNSYVALAKGPVTDGHTVCIPINHSASLSTMSEEIGLEILNISNNIRAFEIEKGNDVAIFERYIPMTVSKAMHMQVHVISFPQNLSRSVRDHIHNAFERRKMKLNPVPGATNQPASSETEIAVIKAIQNIEINNKTNGLMRGSKGYIYVALPGNNTARGRLQENYLWIEGEESAEEKSQQNQRGGFRRRDGNSGNTKIPMNFMRDIISYAIGVPERADWKACVGSAEEEGKTALSIRRGYAQWKKVQTS